MTDRDRLARPKGRSLDDSALRDVEALLPEGARRRDHLIEYLHVIQDHYGHLAARHLKALAEVMRLSEVEIFEVASFYHHFDVVKEGDAAPAPLTVRVCTSLSCALEGAEALLRRLQTLTDTARVRVLPAPCLGRCAGAPAAHVGKRAVENATADSLASLAARAETTPIVPTALDFPAYRAAGGYALYEAVLRGTPTADAIIEALSASGLRGLGGAGFPVGRKWAAVRRYPGPRLMTINADEGEPGTFKDRQVLSTDPHRVLEATMIAASVVGCDRVYLYLRDEYPEVRAVLIEAIAALAAAYPAAVPIELRRGAGAYVCGEESAMLESIEGRRGLPRHRPPYIAERGLFGRPTLNHNVETLYWLRDILEKGADWFAGQGVRGCKGLRSFSVSGRVARPGIVVAPAGSTANELIAACGGMREGHHLAAFLPGGASGGILPAALANEPLDFGTLDRFGAFVGSHALIVLSQTDDLRAVARNLLDFFAHESCGQCTPCRAGTVALATMFAQSQAPDPLVIADLDHVMREASICGLGQAAANPVASLVRFFPAALEGRQ